MSKIGAVICELNPLHNGHKRLIELSKQHGITHLIGIISGNFVQRGEPSIISCQTRAQLALSCGFDLLIEIPPVWAMATAEKFAYSGVYIAQSLGCVDSLIFGSECCDFRLLDKISDFLMSSLFSKTLKTYLDLGLTFAAARELAIKDILGERYAQSVKKPNDILAVEYLKTLKTLGSSIKPLPIKRSDSFHDSPSPSGSFASSSYIRNCLTENNNNRFKYLPHECQEIISKQILDKQAPVTIKPMERAILYKLKTMSKQDFLSLPDISEGLENRIFAASSKAASFKDLISMIKTKRYTHSRIKRLIMYAFLGIYKSDQEQNIPYIKVLGADSKGLEILKNSFTLPVVSRHCDYKKLDSPAKNMFDKNAAIDKIYSLMAPEISPFNGYNRKIIIKKDD